jgi:hypothetical protein
LPNNSFSRILRSARPRRRWPGCLKESLFAPCFILSIHHQYRARVPSRM